MIQCIRGKRPFRLLLAGSFLLFITLCSKPITASDQTTPIASTVHCVGENFNSSTTWKEQSCFFTNLCFSTSTKSSTPTSNLQSFLYFQSDHERRLQQLLVDQQQKNQELIRISTIAWDPLTTTKQVSLGAIISTSSDELMNDKARYLPWFPQIVTEDNDLQELRREFLPTILVPVRFTTPMTETSLWKDMFAIYTVISMFGLLTDDRNITIFPMQGNGSILRHEWLGQGLGAAVKAQFPSSSVLTCASHAVAGLGRILDGGTHVMFRGIGLYEFGVYAKKQILNQQPERARQHSKGKTANKDSTAVATVVSQNAKDGLSSFTTSQLLVSNVPSRQVMIESLADIAETTTNISDTAANIWIISVKHPFLFPLATMLPRGAVLLVQEEESTNFDDGNSINDNDREFLQSLTHVRVRFLPRNSSDQDESAKATMALIQEELRRTQGGKIPEH